MENKKEKVALNDEVLDKVAGGSFGCGEVKAIMGSLTCNCTGEAVEMVQVGSDETGRIVTYQCPRCGATETVYE